VGKNGYPDALRNVRKVEVYLEREILIQYDLGGMIIANLNGINDEASQRN